MLKLNEVDFFLKVILVEKELLRFRLFYRIAYPIIDIALIRIKVRSLSILFINIVVVILTY